MTGKNVLHITNAEECVKVKGVEVTETMHVFGLP